MKKHKIVWFYIFTVICTVILGGLSSAFLDISVPSQYAISLATAQMSPLCGLLFLCIFSRNFGFFKEMKWSIELPQKFIWLIVSLIVPAIIICGSAFTLSIMGSSYIQSGYGINLSLLVVITATVLGCVGEEIGWRGFMLPAFRKKHSLFLSSIFTGLLWGAWHFGKISLFGVVGYLLFILLITEFTVLMALIYDKTGKSLLPMILFHFTVNICSMLILNNREGISFYIAGCIIGGILCAVAVLSNKSRYFNKKHAE